MNNLVILAELSPTLRPFPFLSLPPELRTTVYLACTNDRADSDAAGLDLDLTGAYVGHHANPAYEQARKAKINMDLYSSLLGTCRQVRLEAVSIFDSHGQCIPSISQTYAFLRSMGRPRRVRLRRLSFVYHLTPNHRPGVSDKLAELELAVKCFRLIRKDCHRLQELAIYMDEQYMKQYERIAACSGNCSGHTDADNAALDAFNVRERPGIVDLRSIRDIKRVEFVPVCDDFSEDLKSILNEFASEMRGPKKARRAIHERGQGGRNEARGVRNRRAKDRAWRSTWIIMVKPAKHSCCESRKS